MPHHNGRNPHGHALRRDREIPEEARRQHEHEPWRTDDRFGQPWDEGPDPDWTRTGDQFAERDRVFSEHPYDRGYAVRDRERDTEVWQRAYSGEGGQSGAQAGAPGPHRGKGPAGFHPSDERIRERACEALTDHDAIDATGIEVRVDGGEITLAGTVEDRRTKRLAEECVEVLRGVRDVHNELRIADRRQRP